MFNVHWILFCVIRASESIGPEWNDWKKISVVKHLAIVQILRLLVLYCVFPTLLQYFFVFIWIYIPVDWSFPSPYNSNSTGPDVVHLQQSHQNVLISLQQWLVLLVRWPSNYLKLNSLKKRIVDTGTYVTGAYVGIDTNFSQINLTHWIY